MKAWGSHTGMHLTCALVQNNYNFPLISKRTVMRIDINSWTPVRSHNVSIISVFRYVLNKTFWTTLHVNKKEDWSLRTIQLVAIDRLKLQIVMTATGNKGVLYSTHYDKIMGETYTSTI